MGCATASGRCREDVHRDPVYLSAIGCASWNDPSTFCATWTDDDHATTSDRGTIVYRASGDAIENDPVSSYGAIYPDLTSDLPVASGGTP